MAHSRHSTQCKWFNCESTRHAEHEVINLSASLAHRGASKRRWRIQYAAIFIFLAIFIIYLRSSLICR